MATFFTIMILLVMEFFVMRQLFIDVHRLKKKGFDDLMDDLALAQVNGPKWIERDMDEGGRRP